MDKNKENQIMSEPKEKKEKTTNNNEETFLYNLMDPQLMISACGWIIYLFLMIGLERCVIILKVLCFLDSLSFLKQNFLRTSEVILFSNLLFFYWHFVEILWIFIFLVFYKSYSGNSLNKRNHIDKIYFILTDRHKMKDTNERREILNHKLLIRERKEKKKCERNLHYYY